MNSMTESLIIRFFFFRWFWEKENKVYKFLDFETNICFASCDTPANMSKIENEQKKARRK